MNVNGRLFCISMSVPPPFAHSPPPLAPTEVCRKRAELTLPHMAAEKKMTTTLRVPWARSSILPRTAKLSVLRR